MCVESGMARSKNSINVAVKNMADFIVALLGFWAVGYGLMFGLSASGFFGTSDFLPSLDSPWNAGFFVFQAVFCGTAATIDGGAIAERTHFSAYLVISIGISVCIYPVFGHWAWGDFLHSGSTGWLQARGFHDFAGSTVVHSIGGWVALAGVLKIGPRTGRFTQTSQRFHPSSIGLVYLGTFILFFGWFGFNCGSTLAANQAIAPIAAKTLLSGCAGGLACATVSRWVSPTRTFNPEHISNGVLGGLVGITAGCDVVTMPSAVLIGLFAGVLVYTTTMMLERWQLDDVVGAIPVHGVCGAWGTLAVGLFISELPAGTPRSAFLGTQALGVCTAFVWAFGSAWTLLTIIQAFVPLRVSPEHEAIGLNVAEHNASSGLLDMAAAMQKGMASGIYDAQLKVDPEYGTEVGDLGHCFNTLVDTIADEQQRTRSEKDRLELILNSTGDALVTVNTTDGRVLSPISTRALAWFGTPAGKSIWTYLYPDSEAEAVEFELAFSQFQDGILPFDLLAGQMPTRFHRGDRCFAISYQEITADGQDQACVLLAISDISSELELEAHQRQQTEVANIVAHITRDQQDFLRFLDEVQELLQGVADSRDEKEQKGLIHTLKGNTAMFGFTTFADMCHSVENDLIDGELTSRHVASLQQTWKQSVEQVQQFIPTRDRRQVNVTMTDISALVGSIRNETSYDQLEDLVQSFMFFPTKQALIRLKRHASRLSEQLGKRVVVVVEDNRLRVDLDQLQDVFNAMVHLVSNALDHGLETPQERVAAGKPEAGQLVLRTESNGGELIISLTDDGRGIDWDKVRAAAKAKNIPHATDDDLRRALFTDGLSTRDAVTKVSGRGVGMGALGAAVKEAGGYYEVRTRAGRGTTFALHFPAHSCGFEAPLRSA